MSEDLARGRGEEAAVTSPEGTDNGSCSRLIAEGFFRMDSPFARALESFP